MNETKRISQAHQHIRPLVERVWGVNRNSSSRAHAERRRVQMFEDSLSLLVNTCEGVAANIDIPYLNPQQIERAVRELKQAEKKLKEIRGQIERTGT